MSELTKTSLTPNCNSRDHIHLPFDHHQTYVLTILGSNKPSMQPYKHKRH